MTDRFVRSSKYRHVYGQDEKQNVDKCFNLASLTNNYALEFLAANSKFFAMALSAKGRVAVMPYSMIGYRGGEPPVINTNCGDLTELRWDPFNDNVLATAANSGEVKIWFIPDDISEGWAESESIRSLENHEKRCTALEWNPCVKNILATAGFDSKILVWNIEDGTLVSSIQNTSSGGDELASGLVSMSWDVTGTNLAVIDKENNLRIFDARTGQLLQSVELCHKKTNKSTQVVQMWNKEGHLITTGFGEKMEQEIKIWKTSDTTLEKVGYYKIDSQTTTHCLYTIYDPDNSILFVAGKGDSAINYFEIKQSEDSDKVDIFHLSAYLPSRVGPQRGICALSKRAVDVGRHEIVRIYKSFNEGRLVEPISFIVPRKSGAFQEDIFPDTLSSEPAMLSSEWVAPGAPKASPKYMSMRERYVPQEGKLDLEVMEKPTSSNTADASREELENQVKQMESQVNRLKNELMEKDARIRQLETQLNQ